MGRNGAYMSVNINVHVRYIICSMASRCVSAISAFCPSKAGLDFALGAILGFRFDIVDTHLEAMLYLLHIIPFV